MGTFMSPLRSKAKNVSTFLSTQKSALNLKSTFLSGSTLTSALLGTFEGLSVHQNLNVQSPTTRARVSWHFFKSDGDPV